MSNKRSVAELEIPKYWLHNDNTYSWEHGLLGIEAPRGQRKQSLGLGGDDQELVYVLMKKLCLHHWPTRKENAAGKLVRQKMIEEKKQ